MLQENSEYSREFVWEKMESKAHNMLIALQSYGKLPLSALICRPPHKPFEGDLKLCPEFEELQSRYTVLKLLVSQALMLPQMAIRC